MTDTDSSDLLPPSPATDEEFTFPIMENLLQCDDSSQLNRIRTLEILKNKVKDGKRAIVRLKRQQEDTNLDIIMNELLNLESYLRSEQSMILSELATRDVTISTQRQEIEKLRRDNRRLINRLKKISESNKGKGSSSAYGEREDKTENKKASKGLVKRCSESRPLTKQRVMTTLTSQFYEKSALCYTDGNGKIIDRVTHKPPIAEKPKICFARATRRPVTAVVRALNGQSNIVSTISRLLEEESDHGINGSSGSSEPSSPESTLKPNTPRVISLARQYEKGVPFSNESSSGDSGRSGDEPSVRTMMMDEYEVTSGYNSDAVSDLDHDYENILLYREAPQNSPNENNNGDRYPLGEEDDDNYVTMRALRDEVGDIILVDAEDQNIYTNVECSFRGARLSQSEDVFTKNRNDEANLSVSKLAIDCAEDVVQNVPRSRHNINLVIRASEESRLLENFEEFSLDALDLEDYGEGDPKEKEALSYIHFRHCGDGAETPATSNEKKAANQNASSAAHGGYERFLEVTGLSQKSILTPSRMFSNHRSVLKPRDIKHRDKLRAALTTLSTVEEIPPCSENASRAQSSSQRYWRENYL